MLYFIVILQWKNDIAALKNNDNSCIFAHAQLLVFFLQ